jgi:membrane protein
MRDFLVRLQQLGIGLVRGLVAAGRRMWNTGGTNLAATLAFYAILSMFPLLILVIALISWIANFPASVNEFLDTLAEFAPDYVIETIRGPLEKLVASGTGAGTVFGIGIILVVWSASGYVGAFGWSANQVGGVSEKRPYLSRLFLRLGVAVLVAIVLLLALMAIILTENASHWIGEWIADLGGTIDVWSTVRWPLFFVAAFFLTLILFSTGPYSRKLSFREMAPGALLGVLLWGLASWGFGVYLDYIGQYSLIYGSMAAIVVFLMWLWLFNLALLYGVSVNAEIREWRQRKRMAQEAADQTTTDLAAPEKDADSPKGSSGNRGSRPAVGADEAPAGEAGGNAGADSAPERRGEEDETGAGDDASPEAAPERHAADDETGADDGGADGEARTDRPPDDDRPKPGSGSGPGGSGPDADHAGD